MNKDKLLFLVLFFWGLASFVFGFLGFLAREGLQFLALGSCGLVASWVGIVMATEERR
jgi:hypothetical protein